MMKKKFQNKLCLLALRCENFVLSVLTHIIWPKNIEPNINDTICIYKPGNIGDLMCSIPAFNAARKKYPKTKIVLYTHGGRSVNATSVLKGFPAIDEIVTFEINDLQTREGINKIVYQIREINPKYFIMFPNENAGFLSQLKHLFIFAKSGIPCVRGFHVTYFPYFTKAQYQLRQFDREVVRAIKCLPFEEDEIDFSYPMNNEDIELVENKLTELQIEKERLLLISPIGKAPANSWPIEFFIEICNLWNEKYGKAVLIGAGIDQIIIDKFCSNGVVNLSGYLSIQQSLCLMRRSELLLTVDTGTAHMASVTGIKCIGVYSSRNMPEQWFPFGNNVTVISKTVRCSPCRLKECPRNNMCMREITVEEVWSTIEDKEKGNE